MAETRTIELNIVDNANQTQQQFENLRQQIAKTTQEVDELTQAYGENSQEVTEAKGRLNELNTSYKELNKSATVSWSNSNTRIQRFISCYSKLFKDTTVSRFTS